MGIKLPAIDAYINNAAAFAIPILTEIRKIVHDTCPEVEERMKWSMPHFDYKKQMMCSMAAFKQHCVVGFWKAALMSDPLLIENAKSETAMGHLGRICSLADLPPVSRFEQWIREAMDLNDRQVKLPAAKKNQPGKELILPDYLVAALKLHPAAWKTFDQYGYSHKKEYVEWISEAKTDATRNKRIATTIQWLEEGKDRHWQYKK